MEEGNGTGRNDETWLLGVMPSSANDQRCAGLRTTNPPAQPGVFIREHSNENVESKRETVKLKTKNVAPLRRKLKQLQNISFF